VSVVVVEIAAHGFEGRWRFDRITVRLEHGPCRWCRDTACPDHRPTIARCMVAGPTDKTPRAFGWNGNTVPQPEPGDPSRAAWRSYDPACGCCYLNISHSVAAHDAATGAMP
jgi:hypothetical protein